MLFRCKNCGGNIVYNPAKKAMCCPHCDSLDSEEKITDGVTILPTSTMCTSCGAPVELKEHTSATRCSNCGTYLVIDERVQGQFEPHLIIPFKVGKEEVKQILHNEFDKRPFTPAGFLSNASIDKMEGTYVPFFLYDYHSDMSFRAIGTKVRSWSDGNYEYTETSYFDVAREMYADFDKVPVDASEYMDDELMDLLEPYEYNDLENHQDKYLSGFLAEKYNMGEIVLSPRAEVKVKNDSHTMLRGTVSGYATLTDVNERITPSKRKVDYALLPVWEYVFGYQGKNYRFHVNGQTGKVLGKTPVSKQRVVGYGFTVFGMMTLLGMMIRLALLAL